MKLCLVRHGEAVERTPLLSDSWRYLTSAGRASFRKISAKAGKQGLDPDCILTSPLVRAVQTAEILAQVLEYQGPVEVAEELSPGFALVGFRKIMDHRGNCRELVLVGHEPDLGILAGQLLGTGSAVPLTKGAVLSLKLDMQSVAASGRFRWLVAGNKVSKELP